MFSSFDIPALQKELNFIIILCQVLSLLAQFPSVETALVASLGGNEEGRMILRDLELEGVVTKFCKIWRDSGVPNSWVLHSGLSSNKTRLQKSIAKIKCV